MGFALSGLLGVAAVVLLTPAPAEAQSAQAPAPPPAPAPPAPAPSAPAPSAAVPAASAPPAAAAPPAPAPSPAPAPAATGPIQLPQIATPIATQPAAVGGDDSRPARRALDPRAAVKSSPFIDATLAGLWLEQRFGDPIVFGLQGGAYFGEAVRLVVRLEMPSKSASDEFTFKYEDPSTTTFYVPRDSTGASLLYGASLGVVAASNEGFVFAPGIVFQRSDVEDYGTMLGIAVPFEWVTVRGLRFGMEIDLGRAFGGTVHYTCSGDPSDPAVCGSGATYEGERGAGRAFALRFQMGFGFNHPRAQ